MHKKGHLIIGCSLMIATNIINTPDNLKDLINLGIMDIGIFTGSFLPDIDAKYSYISRKLKKLSDIYKKMDRTINKLLGKKENILTKHRGLLMHSFYTLIPFLTVYLIFNNHIIKSLNLGLFIGLLGHHIGDMIFSSQGLYYFYPFSIEKIFIFKKTVKKKGDKKQ